MGKTFLKGLFTTGAAAFAGYTFLVRPWYVRWGASDEEVRQTLPGDDLVKLPRFMTTRALTIAAPPSAIWPWLVQMGQDRGGLYSYDRLENLAGLDIHSTNDVLPQWQQLEVGDRLRLTPEQRGDLALEVRQIEARQSLVLCTPGDPVELLEAGYPFMSWTFLLKSQDEQTTRLIIRSRFDYKPTMMGILLYRVFLEPAHFLMERKMLLGIKRRVEQANQQKAAPEPSDTPVLIV